MRFSTYSIAYASSEGSGESAHMSSLARAFAANSNKMETLIKVQIKF